MAAVAWTRDVLMAAVNAYLHVAMQEEEEKEEIRRSIEKAVGQAFGRLTDSIVVVEARAT